MPSRRRRYRHRPKTQVRKPPSNEEIRFPEMRLVDVDGSQLGVFTRDQALLRAEEQGCDLVIVASKAEPPVVRLMDLGKHMYEQRKKQAKQKAKSKGKDIKGVRLGFKTDEHDWNMRLKQATRFLESGHKVRVEIRLRGREKGRRDLAEEKLRQFMTTVFSGVPARQEDKISHSHNNLSVIMAPHTK